MDVGLLGLFSNRTISHCPPWLFLFHIAFCHRKIDKHEPEILLAVNVFFWWKFTQILWHCSKCIGDEFVSAPSSQFFLWPFLWQLWIFNWMDLVIFVVVKVIFSGVWFSKCYVVTLVLKVVRVMIGVWDSNSKKTLPKFRSIHLYADSSNFKISF